MSFRVRLLVGFATVLAPLPAVAIFGDLGPRPDDKLAHTMWAPQDGKLKRLAREVGARHGDERWADIFEALQTTVYDQKQLWPNVDLYAAGVYRSLGVPTDLMTSVFALARMAGWTAHVREQYADNRVIRPGSIYVGPGDRVWVPIDERGGQGGG